MNALPLTPPKHWVLRALLMLGFTAASCTVPNFEVAKDDGGGVTSSHCSDLISDDGETGIDCGGTCPGCAPGGTCMSNNDCAGNQCLNNVCQDASCTDGVQSGTETDVDCGGGACSPCAAGLRCVAARDCASSVCLTGSCAQPSCTDTIQNGDESDVDCGGSCTTCLPGQKCKLPTDCAGGACTNGLCTLTCLDGKGNCDGDDTNGCETNLKTDASHCGACDTPCNLPHATSSCSGGACVIGTCVPPYADCDGNPANGCEVNTSTDSANCATCGSVCPSTNGTPSCVASACQISCSAGYADCDNDTVNGCEKQTSLDVSNCGSCGNVCPTTLGSATCAAGVCGVSNCRAGLGDCNPNALGTCPTDTTTDVNNCGGCGSACVVPHATPSCVASACKVGTCDAGWADCDGKVANGCETNIAGDAANCGGCATACNIANATSKCVNQVCKVATCTAPWADCDGNGTDCETNTSTNSANCGGCGTNGVNCTNLYANATGKCVASSCQLAACAANFADCNPGPLDSDGCESNLKTSSSNCGACGVACQAPHGTNTCTAGTCTPSCGTLFGDCDGNVKTGCEAVFANDPNNCGACTTVCQQTNAVNVCNSGACSPTCSQNYFKSCDSNNNNGCETDDRSSKANCGGCAMPCLDNQTSSNNCVNSACQPACLANHKDCDNNPNNGCETATASDPANCGGCNVTCLTQNATATTCSSGACKPTCDAGFGACTNPTAGCTDSITTAAHCGSCATSCTGGTPFCVSQACTAALTIGVVNSSTVGTSTSQGQPLTVPHVLQTSAASNAYRLVVVGVTGFGNGAASLPTNVTYNGVNMTAVQTIMPTNQVSAAIYILQGASLPAAAGTYNVVLTSAGTNSFVLNANVMELINVEQATGATDAIGGEANNNSCTAHKPSDPVLVNQAGDYIYSIASVYGSVNDPGDGGGSMQTVTEQITAGSLGTVAGYLKAPMLGSNTITWNIGACSASAHALMAIKPAITP